MPTETTLIGKKAPSFSLLNQHGKKVSLKDFAGHWLVLYFYPKDDTPGCTTEACQFTTDWKQFEKLSARVVGVSPDSPESHTAFIGKFQLKVDLLSDPDHETLEAYGAWGEKNLYGKISTGVLRSTVLIDPKGKIVHQWQKVKADGHAKEVAEKLAELHAEEK